MKLWFLLGMLLIPFSSTNQAAPQQSQAEQIVSEVLAAYSSYFSYVDEGEVRTIFHQPNGPRTVVKPFSTAFVRPYDFRFEYRDRRGEDEWNRYIIWSSRDSVKRWWSVRPGVETPADLRSAVGAAAGVSSRSSTIIPALLMPGTGRTAVAPNWLRQLSNLTLLGLEDVNGSPAHKIQGTDSRNEVFTFWVDERTRLIVKTYEISEFPTFRTETTRTYKPQTNVQVDPQRLAFDAPAEN